MKRNSLRMLWVEFFFLWCACARINVQAYAIIDCMIDGIFTVNYKQIPIGRNIAAISVRWPPNRKRVSQSIGFFVLFFVWCKTLSPTFRFIVRDAKYNCNHLQMVCFRSNAVSACQALDKCAHSPSSQLFWRECVMFSTMICMLVDANKHKYSTHAIPTFDEPISF